MAKLVLLQLGQKLKLLKKAQLKLLSGVINDILGNTGKTSRYPLRERIEDDIASATAKAVVDENTSPTKTIMLRRHYFLRNMYMPFQLAFANKDISIIYESFNPELEESKNGKKEKSLAKKEMKYAAILGYANSGFDNFISYPINNKISSTFWKNMVFCYVKGTGTGSSLVYFDWIYKYYHFNFLKTQKHNDSKFLNIIPAFYTLQNTLKKAVEKASDDNKADAENNYKEFCELNSNLFVLDSEAPAKEMQFHIGKMLASFILLNSAIEFDVPGKLFRRPNEIIKINKSSNPRDINDKDDNIDLTAVDTNAMYTNRGNTNSTMLYVRRVTHNFKGNNYTNKIYGNRIFDML